MKKIKVWSSVIILIILAFMITACAKNDSAKYSDKNSSYDYDAGESVAPQEPSYSDGALDDYATPEEEKAEVDFSNTSSVSSKIPKEDVGEKIIRRVFMTVETEEFDNLISTIDYQIEALGGYVESSEIIGKGYYQKDNLRGGNIVARIPKDRLSEFTNKVKEIGNVTSNSQNTENVTLKYVDADSHKKSLKIEQERLLALLDKAESLEDILILESRLSDVRYQLQYYETQLRTYDNLVEYSTVTLNIREVKRITPVTEEELNVWERISSGFGDTMYKIGQGLQNFFVWFVVNLPYLMIWAVIIAIGVLVGKKIYKRAMRNARTQQNVAPRIMPNMNPNMNQNMNPNMHPNPSPNLNQNIHPNSNQMNQNNQTESKPNTKQK